VTPRLTLGALVLAVLPSLPFGAAAPSVPDTSAGRALGSWLKVFNSGDRAGIESFITTQAAWLDLDSFMTSRAQMGDDQSGGPYRGGTIFPPRAARTHPERPDPLALPAL
jgi:hypothetical protein